MFILTKEKGAEKVLEAYISAFEKTKFNFGKIYTIAVEDYTLYWFSAKPQDQLYIYNNGLIIGKKSFEDTFSTEPVYLDKNLPQETHSLLQNTIIRIKNNKIFIEPNEITSVFYDKNFSASDYSILLAKLNNNLPDSKLVQLLTAVGYFPGNLTLFSSIKRIPYLFTVNLTTKNIKKTGTFEMKKPDDATMVNRLIEILPTTKKQSLGMSGGLDSRFVLGLLLKKGIRPLLRSLKDKENPIVDKLNKFLKLEYNKIEGKKEDALRYTLMTDARIYFRGGNYSGLFKEVNSDEILHTGLSILPMNENSFASAWKKPGFKKTIYNDLINYALLSRTPNKGFSAFREIIDKASLQRFLERELSYGKMYSKFKTRKQWALWFYHLNRGLTWTPVHLMDASFYAYPIFILGDKKAAEYGIGSSAYSNFNKERLRKINQKLFPDLRIDYSDNRQFNSKPFLKDHFERIYNEYFKKLINRFKHLKKDQSSSNHHWFENLDLREAKHFSDYYNASFEEIIKNENEAIRVRRVAVTLNNTLMFLEK